MSNLNYSGYWYNEEEGSLVLSVMVAATSGDRNMYYPNVYKIDMDTNIKKQVFPPAGQDMVPFLIPPEVIIVRYENPVICFNRDTKTYTIAFLIFGDNGGMWMHTVDLIEKNKYLLELKSVPSIYIMSYQPPPPDVEA